MSAWESSETSKHASQLLDILLKRQFLWRCLSLSSPHSPILEYVSCVWSPYQVGKSNKWNLFKGVSPEGCNIIHVLIIK